MMKNHIVLNAENMRKIAWLLVEKQNHRVIITGNVARWSR